MKRFLIALAFVLPFSVAAQDSDLGNWFIYIGSKDLGNGFNLHHEAQYRNYNFIGDLEQLLLRTGVGYDLTENNNNVLLGYAYILSENYISEDEKNSIGEHRIFQQFITKQSFGRFAWQHRYRSEQRWVENQDFKTRYRYFLSVNAALNTPKLEDGSVYLSAYNEIFINGEGQLYDRNRIYGGVGYRLNKNVRFELGYMAQLLQGFSRDQANIFVLASF